MQRLPHHHDQDGTSHFIFEPIAFIERLAAVMNSATIRAILDSLHMPAGVPAMHLARAPPES